MTRAAATLAGLVSLAALTGCTAPAPVPTQQPTRAATAHPVVTPVAITPPTPDANELARLTYSSGSSMVTTSVTFSSQGETSYVVNFACQADGTDASITYAIKIDGADLESATPPCDSEPGTDIADLSLPKGSTVELSMSGDFSRIRNVFVVLSRG